MHSRSPPPLFDETLTCHIVAAAKDNFKCFNFKITAKSLTPEEVGPGRPPMIRVMRGMTGSDSDDDARRGRTGRAGRPGLAGEAQGLEGSVPQG